MTITNKVLQDFYEKIHKDLKPAKNGNCFVIKEQESKSAIKQISLAFKNSQDVILLQQKAGECPAITNLFQEKPILNSCDFIVLMCKNKDLHILFCEIKSSNNEENRKKALKQIVSSKIFLEYLYKNYLEHFETKNFKIPLEKAKNIYIYPASIPQKKATFASQNLIFKTLEIDSKGVATIKNAYEFFGA
ncbi:hypothetical protein [Helicobacter turcicus]|uniref:Restriction endonuclease n=1 Tax=Helicobacter turcicus TaxID=2867412 RepID=A0ABS7JMX6_9HELI|nr:hypothetical protein [Helicobacter turcicus]MBX7490747.1 hypothetical protein [Helicobacter turcicus]MBX7545644.1 hypothetical protein [Helicobacter turcicus]